MPGSRSSVSDEELTPEPADDAYPFEGEEEQSDIDDYDDGDDIDDDDYGDVKKRAAPKPKPLHTFPSRRPKSESEEDYAGKSHKRKLFAKATSVDSGSSWRRDAAKKVVTYDETMGNEDLLDSASEPEALAGETDEIDMILSHSRDEEHLADPQDLPHSNLRYHVKWKGYSHVHNTDELYPFLKTFKGAKKVDNYIAKVWTVEQQYLSPGASQPSREELEQFQLEKERVQELYESHKIVERVLAVKDGKYFCKWTNLQYADCSWEGETRIDEAYSSAQRHTQFSASH